MTEPGRTTRTSEDTGAVNAGVPATTDRRNGRRAREAGTGRRSSPHASRFRLLTGVLVACAVAALIIAATLAVQGRPHHAAGSRWSQWSPPSKGTDGAREIADYVSPLYRISATNQLAVVTVVNLQSAAQTQAQAQAAANGTTPPQSSGLQVAVRPNPSSSAVSLLTGNTIAYNLCGIGSSNCAIGVGQPSTARELLLRREALELALYTFKYLGSTQNVVAILPPGHEQVTSSLTKTLPKSSGSSDSKPVDIAVLFQRQELAPLLAQPLSATLPEQIPPTVSQMPSAPEAGLVEQVTARGLFSEQLQQAQDGSNLIMLNPLPPQ